MAIENIELEEVKGAAEVDTPEATEEATQVTTLDEIEAALDEFDLTENKDDNTAETATKAEEVSLDALRDEISELRDENKRLAAAIGRLIKGYGAKLNEKSTQGIEAFRESSVEPKLPSDELNLSGVPGLADIKLG